MAPFIKSSFGNKNYFLIILRKLNEINYNILKPPGTPHHVDSVTVQFFEFFFPVNWESLHLNLMIQLNSTSTYDDQIYLTTKNGSAVGLVWI